MYKVAKFEKISEERYNEFRKNVVELDVINYEDIKLPTRATRDSAGYDFYITQDIVLEPGRTVLIPTFIRCHFYLDGWFLMLTPKSGLGFKYQLSLANTVGIVDADYYFSDNEGNIMIKLVNRGDTAITLKAGDKFAQGIFLPYGITIDDDEVEKEVRNGGFGSTGE